MATDSKYSMFVLYMLMASVHNDINAHCSLLKMAASQLVTGQLVTRSTRHTVNSSQANIKAILPQQYNYPYPESAIAAITQKMHKKLSRKQSEQQSTRSVRLLLKPTSL